MLIRQRLSIVLLVLGVMLLIRILFGGVPALPVTDEQHVFRLFFPSRAKVILFVEYRQGQGTIEDRLAALAAGPSSDRLLPVLPENTRIVGYSVDGTILTVDFSRELVTNHPGGSSGELVTVYGIVNSLVEHDAVDAVQILVEGQTVGTLAGHIDLRYPLAFDRSIVGDQHL